MPGSAVLPRDLGVVEQLRLEQLLRGDGLLDHRVHLRPSRKTFFFLVASPGKVVENVLPLSLPMPIPIPIRAILFIEVSL
jgi:hypothetical protein